MQYRLTTVHAVIARVIRELGLGDREIDWQSYLEVIADGMQHIGAYTQYEEKVVDLTLDKGRTKLPCDFYRITEGHSERYKIVGDTIIVDTPRDTFKMSYLAFKLDENGFPLIPDHVSYMEALTWRVACYLSMRGELPNKEISYADCRQKWNFYCRQARSKMTELDEQEKALFARSFLTLGPNINRYPNFGGITNKQVDGRD